MLKIYVNEATQTYWKEVENTGDYFDFQFVEAVRGFVDNYFTEKK
jgi:hypothetical protein